MKKFFFVICALCCVQAAQAEINGDDLPEVKSIDSGTHTRFSVHASYNFADSISSDEFTFQAGASKTKGSSKSEVEKGFGIGGSYYLQLNDSKFEIEFGFFYEMPKALKSMSYNLNGTTITGKLSTAKISTAGILANFLYNIENSYVLAGLNMSRPEISGVTGESISTAASFGGQVGYGYNMNKNFSIEGIYKRVSYHIDEKTDDGAYYANHTKAVSDGLVVQAKFRF